MIYLAIFLVVFVIVVLTINARKPKDKDFLPLDKIDDLRKENQERYEESKKELGPVACGLLESFKNEKEKWDAYMSNLYISPIRAESKYINYDKDITIFAYKPNNNIKFPDGNKYWVESSQIDCKFTDYEHEVLSKYIWENFETEEERKEKQEAKNRKKNAEYFANMCPNNKKE